MRRRLVLLAVWVAGAAVAVALSMWAVGLVGGRISGRDSTVVSQRDVEQALAVSTTVDTATTDTTAPPTEPAPSTSAPPDAGEPVRGGDVGSAPLVDAPPATPAPSPAAVASAPTGQEAVYTTAGGTVAVRCSGSTVSLLYATPAPGWQLHGSAGTGPAEVDVRFEPASDAKGREVRVRVRCEGGVPIDEVRTEG